MDIAPAQATALNLGDFNAEQGALLQEYSSALHGLARLGLKHEEFSHTVRFPLDGKVVHLHLADDVDLAAIKARLDKEYAKGEKQLKQLRGRLENPAFVAKAPEEVLEEHRTRLQDLQRTQEQYQAILDALQ